MRKIPALVSILALPFLGILIGCDAGSDDIQPDAPFQNPFDQATTIHSEGLDFTLDQINKSGITKETAESRIAESLASFYGLKGFGSQEMDLSISSGMSVVSLQSRVESASSRFARTDNDNGNVTLNYDGLVSSIYSEFEDPDLVVSYMSRLQAVHYAAESFEALELASLRLEEEASSELSEGGAVFFLASAAIGRDSRRYWEAKSSDWDAALYDAENEGEASSARRASGCDWGGIAKRAGWGDLVGGSVSGISSGVLWTFRMATRAGGFAGMFVGAAGTSTLLAAMDWYDNCSQ